MKDELLTFYTNNATIMNIVIGSLLILVIATYIIFRKKINELYKKNKEIINYIVVGGLTMFVSIASKKIVEEVTKFFTYRLITLGLEVALMALFVSVLSMNDMLSKVILQVVVLVLNYVFSKLFIFKEDKKTTM